MGIYKRAKSVRKAAKGRPTLRKAPRPIKRRRVTKKGRYARAARMQLGTPRASAVKRAEQQVYFNQMYQKRTLTGDELTLISGGTTQFQRSRNNIRITGIKFRIMCLNANDVAAGNPTGKPLWVNFAILSPKTTNTTPAVASFFNSEGGSTTSQAFNDFANLTGLDFATKNINSSEFVVRWHHRFTLGPSTNSTASEWGQNLVKPYKKLSRWTNINRVFAYNDSGSGSCKDKLYFVHWASGPTDAKAAPGTAPADNGYILTGRIVTYFHDVRD